MAGRPKKSGAATLAPLESQIMDVVWDVGGAVSVRDVLEALNQQRQSPLAYTTVMTVMNRLVAKSVLVRQGEPRRYVYEATATDTAALAVRQVIGTHGNAAVAHFVEEARADPKILERLRALLGEAP